MSEDREFYNPEQWRTRYLGKWICPTRVEFDEAEEAMIRQLANKFGYPKEDIVRMAVRDMFVHYIVAEVVE